ncbi:hypothetical protein [uncultured Paraglaciecola sp.]|uniref:class III lanthionine synthetase LanKC N-terminal domain-containing protein n=1 Tax=uncultured Paraglaciecola sp. TaxID=1765024 RepID=UPI0030DC4171|tara:strand:- start:57770 stop:58231 length:462 start_codon:yes stop_codon:yes gene_type:complete
MAEEIKFYPNDGTYWCPTNSFYAQYLGNAPNPCRKYHISSDIPSAETIASVVLPYLSQRRIVHKVVSTMSFLNRQSAGKQAGKFITIYMNEFVSQVNQDIVNLGAVLSQLSEQQGIRPSPRVPRTRGFSHVFIEQPLDEGMFIYGGFIVDPTK